MKNTSAGPNFVPAYQTSGVPYVTSSGGHTVGPTTPIKVTFPYVTRFFTVQNISAYPLRVGFTENGVTANHAGAGGGGSRNFLVISGNQTTGRLEIRCKELYFLADSSTAGENLTGFSLLAGLTGIEHTQFPTITGSLPGPLNAAGVATVTASFQGVG